MALIKKRNWLLATSLVGLISSVLLIGSLLQLYQIKQFNGALDSKNYLQAGEDRSIYGQFAGAYLDHQNSKFDKATAAYSKVENKGDGRFQQAVRYNQANLYLQRAMAARQQGENDIAVPLIELAKHLYRELLRVDPKFWSAKYNLEQALKLAPLIADEELAEDVMPERSPEATGSIKIDRELP